MSERTVFTPSEESKESGENPHISIGQMQSSSEGSSDEQEPEQVISVEDNSGEGLALAENHSADETLSKYGSFYSVPPEKVSDENLTQPLRHKVPSKTIILSTAQKLTDKRPLVNRSVRHSSGTPQQRVISHQKSSAQHQEAIRKPVEQRKTLQPGETGRHPEAVKVEETPKEDVEEQRRRQDKERKLKIAQEKKKAAQIEEQKKVAQEEKRQREQAARRQERDNARRAAEKRKIILAECSSCMEKIKRSTMVTLPCSHLYCKSCILGTSIHFYHLFERIQFKSFPLRKLTTHPTHHRRHKISTQIPLRIHLLPHPHPPSHPRALHPRHRPEALHPADPRTHAPEPTILRLAAVRALHPPRCDPRRARNLPCDQLPRADLRGV